MDIRIVMITIIYIADGIGIGIGNRILFCFGLDNRGICYRNLHSIGNDNINCRICCSSVGILYGIAIIIRTIEGVVGVLGIF